MPVQLSVNDRVLLHLSRFATDTPREEYPPETTQVGIAHAVGISRTHVPRAVKGLMKDRDIEELRMRVTGKERRMSVYVVTPEGFRRAEGLLEQLREGVLEVMIDGRRETLPGAELEEMLGKKRLREVVAGAKDGVLELEKRREPVRLLDDAPPADGFTGRTAELAALSDFMESGSRIAVVLGGRGYGTTALTRRFVDASTDADVLWLTVGEDESAERLQGEVISFAETVAPAAKDLHAALDIPSAIMVFDDYHSVPEEVVEFFSLLVGEQGATKIVITAREDTPAYNWFYQKRHVENGVVREIRVRGLDERSARHLLGNDEIEDDAFRRIYLMSRGQPMMLRLLREGDLEGLKRSSVYTAEELRYLLFLKDKKG